MAVPSATRSMLVKESSRNFSIEIRNIYILRVNKKFKDIVF